MSKISSPRVTEPFCVGDFLILLRLLASYSSLSCMGVKIFGQLDSPSPYNFDLGELLDLLLDPPLLILLLVLLLVLILLLVLLLVFVLLE